MRLRDLAPNPVLLFYFSNHVHFLASKNVFPKLDGMSNSFHYII